MKHPPNNPFSLTTEPTDNSTLSIGNLRLQSLKSAIAEHVLQLHQGVNLNPNLIESTLWEIEKNIFALAYLDLDEKSLREISFLESKIRVQEWLKVLRNGTTLYKNYLNCLIETVEEMGLTLAEIGTDKKELRELEILGFKISAQGWLERIAAGEYNAYLVLINYVREQVIVFGLTLTDIDTTEEKLAELIVFAAKKEASSWLNHLRKSNARNEYFANNVRINVEIGGFLLEEIGTNEEELQMLLARPAETKAAPPESESPKTSGAGAGRHKRFLENLFKNDLLFKVFLKAKESTRRMEGQNKLIQNFFSRLHVKVGAWNLFHHQH